MAETISRFNRLLMVLLVILYVISIGAFSYANWIVEREHQSWTLLVNALILSLPLVLFYGSIYVLISAWLEHRLTGKISTRRAKIIRWAPRAVAIVIIFFISLFSLDVFGMEVTPLELLAGFLIHNIPSIILILVLVFSWHRPVIGFIAFLLAGLIFMFFVISELSLGHFLLFSGPLLLISGLFYADWRWNKPQPPTTFKAGI